MTTILPSSSSSALAQSMSNRLSHTSTSKLNDHTSFLHSLSSSSSSPSSSPSSNESMGLGFGVGVSVGLGLTLSVARPLLSLITAALTSPSSPSFPSSSASFSSPLAAVLTNHSAALSNLTAMALPSLASSPSPSSSFLISSPFLSSSSPSSLGLGLFSLFALTPTQWLLLLLCLSLAYVYHILTRPLIFHRPLTPQAREAALRKSYADMPPPYPNAWFKLADVMDVDGGRTHRVQALGMDLQVGRSASGELWCQDADGALWEVCEVNQVIFVWHDEMRRSSAWQIPVVSPDMRRWRFVGRTTHEIVCHIQEIPENGADVAHLDYLHGDFVLDFISAAKHTWEASWVAQPFPQQHLAKIAIDTQVAVFGHKLAFSMVKTRITQVGPGIVQLMFPTPFGNILLQETITPIHSNVQRACHVLWCEPAVPRIIAKAIMKSTLMQFERDFLVWNSKRWIRAPLAVKEDGPILRYRRWVKQFFDRDGGALVRDFDGNEQVIERKPWE